MKVGDLVKLDSVSYPRQKGEIGMLIVAQHDYCPEKWTVMIAGKIHPYVVLEEDMEAINESR
jgi:hypothetical protein